MRTKSKLLANLAKQKSLKQQTPSTVFSPAKPFNTSNNNFTFANVEISSHLVWQNTNNPGLKNGTYVNNQFYKKPY